MPYDEYIIHSPAVSMDSLPLFCQELSSPSRSSNPPVASPMPGGFIGETVKREAYALTLNFATSQRGRILSLLLHQDLTAHEIEKLLNIKRSAVCGRINELIKRGLITETGRSKDPETNISVTLYGVRK